MKTKEDVLVKYISDQLGALNHTLEAIEQQANDSDLNRFPNASSTLNLVSSVLAEQIAALKSHLHLNFDASLVTALKEGLTDLTGCLAAIYSKVRSEKVSKFLRDDYTALSMLSLTYTMLDATASALDDIETAELARNHLNEITPLVVHLNEVIPGVVVQELTEEGLAVNLDAARDARNDSHDAWKQV